MNWDLVILAAPGILFPVLLWLSSQHEVAPYSMKSGPLVSRHNLPATARLVLIYFTLFISVFATPSLKDRSTWPLLLVLTIVFISIIRRRKRALND